MAEKVLQSQTFRVPIQAYLASDHVSAATGKTIAITISKNGAAYGNPSAGATNATEIANGSYYVDLSTTDTGTLGPLFVRGTAGTIDDVIAIHTVVLGTNMGMTALPAVAAEGAGGLYTRGTGAGQIKQSANGQIDTNPVTLNGTALTGRDIGKNVPLVVAQGFSVQALDQDSLTFAFSTYSNGVLTALAGSPAVTVYLSDGSSNTSSVTFTQSWNSITGLNQVALDLSSLFYNGGLGRYAVVLTAGTLGGITVAGTELASFDFNGDPAHAAAAIWNFDTASISSGIGLAINNFVQTDMRIRKNTALASFPFEMVLSSDHVTPGTGLTVTATRSLDGAAFGACANAVSEIGSGWYKISLAATDTNANTIAFKFTAATADPLNFTVVTQTLGP